MRTKAKILILVICVVFSSGAAFGLELFAATTEGHWDWHFNAKVESPTIIYYLDNNISPKRFYFKANSLPMEIVKSEDASFDTYTVKVVNNTTGITIVNYGQLAGNDAFIVTTKIAPFTITPGAGPHRINAQGYKEHCKNCFLCLCGTEWRTEGGGITIDFISDTNSPQSPQLIFNNRQETDESGVIYIKPETDGSVVFSWNQVADRGTAEDTGAVWGVGVASYTIYEKQGEAYQTIAIIDEPTPTVTPSVTEAPTPTVAGTPEPTPNPEAFSFAMAFPQGTNTFVVTAKDKFGQTSPPNINQVDIVVDATGPNAPDYFMLADSYYKQIQVGSENRFYAIDQSENLMFYWPKPSDMPPDFNAGLTEDLTASSKLYLSDTSSPTVFTYDLAYSNPMINATPVPNGSYNATLSVSDKLGNPGATSSPYLIYIDRQAPPALDPNNITIDDAYATKTISGNNVAFTTTKNSLNLSWQEVTDGNEDWQSEFDAYLFSKYRGSAYLTPERLNNTNKSLTGLATGLNRYKIECLDKAGNKSSEVMIEITVSPGLAKAEFLIPCYELVSDTSYKILWRTETGVSYYKAIVKRASEAVPSQSEWDSVPQIMPSTEEVTYGTFTNPLFGVDLIAYVLAVGTSGGMSIADKLFVLPPATIPPGQPYEITTDEYWTGEKTLEASVIIRAGACLYIERGAHLVVSPGANISITVEGCLIVRGDAIQPGTGAPGAGNVIIESLLTESYIAWKGIIVYGSADITGCAIRNAERGITIAQNAAAVSINGCLLERDRVGIHAYGSRPIVNASTIRNNEWYGIKEDESRESGNKRPHVTDCVFTGNVYNYYHQDKRDVTVDFLNGISGNGGNIYD